MITRPKKLILFCGVCFAASVFLLTCGIEEYYYLPQLPERNIQTQMNTSATISIPPLTEYYASNYSIYYRIYISGHPESGTIDTSSLRSTISPSLSSDFDAIYPNTDPTSTTAGTPANTLFKNRNYFELELDGVDINDPLKKSGGNISILFPTDTGGFPVLSFDGSEIRLFRSKDLISPVPDRYFRNTPDLNDPEKATSNINADVAGRSGLSQRYAYVSMYIVAAGLNPVAFTPVYSKPTHISIFRLPDYF
ncbi:MAG: hypothetical protein LBI04_10915 [Treponema sp.]|jgi:hypothetical protein|nr:hypothetical protein [Treponema sp.]